MTTEDTQPFPALILIYTIQKNPESKRNRVDGNEAFMALRSCCSLESCK